MFYISPFSINPLGTRSFMRHKGNAGPLNIGGRARWPSGRIFAKKSAYAGFYPDKISKFLPQKAKFLIRAKIASYSEARRISELSLTYNIWLS